MFKKESEKKIIEKNEKIENLKINLNDELSKIDAIIITKNEGKDVFVFPQTLNTSSKLFKD